MAQKTHPIAQPTCVETQTVLRVREASAPGLIGVVVHAHRLDGVAAAEVEQHLVRRTIVRRRLGDDRRRRERELLGELRAQRERKVGHILERGRAAL